jgi:glycosyltransferase involved in cell wall biosynthesis
MNNKKLNVYINPGVHPQFKEITNYPPKNVEYYYTYPSGDHNSKGMRTKRTIFGKLHRTGIPRMTYIKNADKYDIIHSTRGIIPLNKKPWVVDLESGAAFSGLSWKYLKNPIMKKILKTYLKSKYCKKILPQSNAAKQSLLENVNCKGFEEKVETLYLAYHTTKLKRKQSDRIRISFIGRDFYYKGGWDLQEAFKILNKKYKISLKYKGLVPKNKMLRLPNVKYLDNIPDPTKFYENIFGDCDIYVQPTTVDSFGVSILEAMSTGLPIVCTDDFTLPELVINGHNGYTVTSEVHWYDERYTTWRYNQLVRKKHNTTVKELIEKISILIEDKKLREKMGRNSFKMVESGKFSIKQRNKQLRRIYDEALE